LFWNASSPLLGFILVISVINPFSFQFFTRLATVFAEEGGGFGFSEPDGPI
jgi:hypothetical protein